MILLRVIEPTPLIFLIHIFERHVIHPIGESVRKFHITNAAENEKISFRRSDC